MRGAGDRDLALLILARQKGAAAERDHLVEHFWGFQFEHAANVRFAHFSVRNMMQSHILRGDIYCANILPAQAEDFPEHACED